MIGKEAPITAGFSGKQPPSGNPLGDTCDAPAYVLVNDKTKNTRARCRAIFTYPVKPPAV